MLVAAYSGRALARAARSAGFVPLVADLFGDLDTRGLADAYAVLPGSLSGGFDEEGTVAALRRLAHGHDPVGIVCGSGFEARPGLVDRLAREWPLLGSTADAVRLLKDPFAFADLCRRLEIPHPAVSAERPEPAAGWLAKLAGGAGGGHVRPAEQTKTPREGEYFQFRLSGIPVSALFLADGAHARVIGWSRQWTDPTLAAPFRYGGAVRLVETSGLPVRAMTRCVEAIAAEVDGLRGLASADFLVDGEDFHLIEINARPGATLDIFAHPDLFKAHIAATSHVMPGLDPGIQGPQERDSLPWIAGSSPAMTSALAYGGSAAAAIVYASRPVASIPAVEWPGWAADRQPPGSAVGVGDPLCTVLAEADTEEGAVRLVEERGLEMHLLLTGAPK